jgi:hypothetical protein
MRRSTFFVLVVLAATAGSASARLIPNWPYDKLTREADVVVVATPVASADTNETPLDEPFRAALTGVETKFAVRAVLKGKLDGDTLKLLHFRLKGMMPPNGPMLVTFPTAKEAKGQAAREHLLFLKHRTDGRFEPVAGQVDSILSVRQLGAAVER